MMSLEHHSLLTFIKILRRFPRDAKTGRREDDRDDEDDGESTTYV